MSANAPAGASTTIRRYGNRAVYFFGLAPAAWAFYLGFTDQLGAEPIKALERTLGFWALRFLLASLAIAPLRHFGVIDLLRYRRTIGLLCFTYAVLHLLVYLGFDQGFDFAAIGIDIAKRPYITTGMLSFVALVPLALTSNDVLIRRMGWRQWKRPHLSIYLASLAAALHVLLAIKSMSAEPLIYAAIALALIGNGLIARIFGWRSI